MALLTKDKINQFGVIEEYWRILSININLQYKYCDVTLGAYANQETRENDKEPMNIKKVRAKWSEDEFEKYFSPRTKSNNIYEQAYQYIKNKDEYFKDSIDV